MEIHTDFERALAKAEARALYLEGELLGASRLFESLAREMKNEQHRRLLGERFILELVATRAQYYRFVDELLPWALRGVTTPVDWEEDQPVWLPGQEEMQRRLASGLYSRERGTEESGPEFQDDNQDD